MKRRKPLVHVVLVIQGAALEFHPGVGFYTACIRLDPDTQVCADPLAAQQPPEDQGLGQAVGPKEGITGRSLYQAGGSPGQVQVGP
jgi:hypothetical protein